MKTDLEAAWTQFTSGLTVGFSKSSIPVKNVSLTLRLEQCRVQEIKQSGENTIAVIACQTKYKTSLRDPGPTQTNLEEWLNSRIDNQNSRNLLAVILGIEKIDRLEFIASDLL